MNATTILTVLLGLVAAWALVILLLWRARPRGIQLRTLVSVVPDVVRLARSILSDPAVPLRVRLALVGLVAWLVSPIDLVPEFIPIVGPIDDVVVAVLVLRYVRRRLGDDDLRRRWSGSPEGLEALLSIL